MSRLRDLLWGDVADIYRAICGHPFITGLTDGTLSRERFGHYLVQDGHYLRGYATALTGCAAKAPTAAESTMFIEHAEAAIAAETQLHTELLTALGIDDPVAHPITPTTQAYMSYLRAVTATGGYAEAVAAVLPCYWIYSRVGEHLLDRGSPDPLYRRWIDTYGAPEFQETVDEVLTVTDRIGAQAPTPDLAAMRTHFHAAARYEWMFWDAAYRMEQWPI